MSDTDLSKDPERRKTTLVGLIKNQSLVFLVTVAPALVLVGIGLTMGLLVAILLYMIVQCFLVWSGLRGEGKGYFTRENSSDLLILALGVFSLVMQNPIWFQLSEPVLFVLGPVSWILLGRSLLTSEKFNHEQHKRLLIGYLAGQAIFPTISLWLIFFSSQTIWLLFYLFWNCSAVLASNVKNIRATLKRDQEHVTG